MQMNPNRTSPNGRFGSFSTGSIEVVHAEDAKGERDKEKEKRRQRHGDEQVYVNGSNNVTTSSFSGAGDEGCFLSLVSRSRYVEAIRSSCKISSKGAEIVIRG